MRSREKNLLPEWRVHCRAQTGEKQIFRRVAWPNEAGHAFTSSCALWCYADPALSGRRRCCGAHIAHALSDHLCKIRRRGRGTDGGASLYTARVCIACAKEDRARGAHAECRQRNVCSGEGGKFPNEQIACGTHHHREKCRGKNKPRTRTRKPNRRCRHDKHTRTGNGIRTRIC